MGLILLLHGQKRAQNLPALPQAIAEVRKEDALLAPEPMQPCWESAQGSLVVGCPSNWSRKEVAGGHGEAGGDSRCDRELCAPRAPSCPWHEAKHSRETSPMATPHPPETRT